MNNNLASFIRAIIAAFGAFFLGKAILGVGITHDLLDGFSGFVLEIVSLVWGIRDKTLTEERLEAAAKNIVSFIGGFLVVAGKLSADKLVLILGVITPLIAWAWSAINKQKSLRIAKGDIQSYQLKKPNGK